MAESGALGALGRRPGAVSKFKLDIIQGIPEGEEISIYRNGDFTDLCAGPHVMRTGNIGAFKLTSVASAYYKGDEKNPQLQRIYGTAFKNKTEMEAYFTMLEEAKKRDHRKLGKELELFIFDDDVGPGLPLWLPNGTVLIEELEKLAKETEFAAGYDRVRTPHLARENMYLTSGHLPYYAEIDVSADDLLDEEERSFSRSATRTTPSASDSRHSRAADGPRRCTTLDHDRATQNQRLRPLLPQSDELPASPQALRRGAAQLSRPAVAPRGIRHLLPLRAERRAFGLMRVRSMQMNDAHIYCTEEQFESEFNAVNEMYLKYFKIFGIDKYLMRFSTHDPAKLGQKFVDQARALEKDRGHGPRRPPAFRHQLRRGAERSRVLRPENRRAGLERHRARIHHRHQPGRFRRARAVSDSFTRPATTPRRRRFAFIARRSGRTSGSSDFSSNITPAISRSGSPPVQVRVLPIGDEGPLLDYAHSILAELRAAGIRAEIDVTSDKINGKMLRAEERKVHTMLVIGRRDLDAGAVSVRVHGKGNLGARARGEVIQDLIAAAHTRRA